MAKLKCKCGNTYFAKVLVNQFNDLPTNLHSSLSEVDVDFDIKIYQCIKCKEYILPPVSYYNMSDDLKKLYMKLTDIIAGKDVPEERPIRRKQVAPGSAEFLSFEPKDPSTMGKFTPQV